ncbi:MAG: hypothetical protein COT18_10875 [Elusimicrobia bacterium CG08_land_8_20_14_0_20_59_10]|nr:MAG: hypothetical protein COT18_10875 [Elusimicrobia bacterium CG08_land_8_20_14_0_20_59_10]
MIRINCDIGERGHLHDEDRRLMERIHIANLACDGHAGDKASVEAFRAMAAKRGVKVSAHLSYPDKTNFGRATMKLPEAGLLAALDAQLALLPGATLVKFHGALYNDACSDPCLANALAGWLKRNNIGALLAPDDSEIASAARNLGIKVLREAFIDRRYAWHRKTGRLALAARGAGGVITDIEEALAQAWEIIKRGRVNVSGSPAKPDWRDIKADTVCIHSDSPIALELADKLRAGLDAYEKAAGIQGNIRLVKLGMCGSACLPVYGRQHLGVSPGGAMDCFSLRRGNLMLGNPEGSPALEIVSPPEIEILTEGRFVLTGSRYDAFLRRGPGEPEQPLRGHRCRELYERPELLEHSRVYEARPGDRLTFDARHYGMYTYFCFRGSEAVPDQVFKGKRGSEAVPDQVFKGKRGSEAVPDQVFKGKRDSAGGGHAQTEAVPFSAVSGWTDPLGRIRVLPGPEYASLEDPGRFFEIPWRTTFKMDRMGMRLAGEPALTCDMGNMISGAVADGTVQLTPDGPIILLRHRQTTGGYPRIFNVISADVDLLAQYAPNQAIHFAQVTLEKAREFARQKEEALAKLASDMNDGTVE